MLSSEDLIFNSTYELCDGKSSLKVGLMLIPLKFSRLIFLTPFRFKSYTFPKWNQNLQNAWD